MNKLTKLKPASVPPRYGFSPEKWQQLTSHMNQKDRSWLLDGISNGFDIYISDSDKLKRSKVKNLPACVIRKLRTTEWIIKNIEKGAIWGPFDPDAPDFPTILKDYRVSPVGAIPKGTHCGLSDEEKKWRVIHHLSHPRNDISVNSEVLEEWSTVSYVSFKEVVKMVHSLGPDALLWTVDAKDAYLRVPIKKKCMKHMCFRWASKLFAFTCLSFGLTSAPRIYTLFADAMLSIIQRLNPGIWKVGDQPRTYHYIDDFFGGAPADQAHIAFEQFNATFSGFEILDVPTTHDKCEGPDRTRKILGFIYDTHRRMLFIPEIKKKAMLIDIEKCLHPGTKRVSRDLIQSLIGKLRWFSNCLWAGPAFVRRMETEVNRLSRGKWSVWIPIEPMKEDLIWWQRAIKHSEDGILMEDILKKRSEWDHKVWTDASTGDGMGGWSGDGQWYRYHWPLSSNDIFRDPSHPDIYWKEMCAVATACVIWGEEWTGKSVLFRCDNEACVYSLNKKSCSLKRPDVMALIRIIADCVNRFKFIPYIIHIPGKLNLTADALSRFDEKKFHNDTNGVPMLPRPTSSEEQLGKLVENFAMICDL